MKRLGLILWCSLAFGLGPQAMASEQASCPTKSNAVYDLMFKAEKANKPYTAMIPEVKSYRFGKFDRAFVTETLKAAEANRAIGMTTLFIWAHVNCKLGHEKGEAFPLPIALNAKLLGRCAMVGELAQVVAEGRAQGRSKKTQLDFIRQQFVELGESEAQIKALLPMYKAVLDMVYGEFAKLEPKEVRLQMISRCVLEQGKRA